jgi:SAM-dependent methyltransferase
MAQPRQEAGFYGYRAGCAGVDSVTKSAEIVAPLIVQRFRPKSVLDVGCGTGDWLREFQTQGVKEVHGYDGAWIPRTGLKIAVECFEQIDLYGRFPAVRRVDLAMCLEVAEHVDEQIGQRIVEFLCASSDVVLWSAAIPGQGGYGHINERYPEHWIGHFARRGFDAFDLVRPEIWMNDRVSWWYQQNLLIFASAEAQKTFALVPKRFAASWIHPAHYDQVRDPRNYSIRQIVRCLPHYCIDRLRRLVGQR